MVPSEPFFSNFILEELTHSSHWASTPCESIKSKIPEPEVKKTKAIPIRDVDIRAQELGFSDATTLNIIEQSALTIAKERSNPAIVEAYRKFLIFAISCDASILDAVDESRLASQEARKQHSIKYRNQLLEYKSKIASVERDWMSARNSTRTKWRSLGKGILKIFKNSNKLDRVHECDRPLIDQLINHGIITCYGNEVLTFKWQEFEIMPIEDIYQILIAVNRETPFLSKKLKTF